jgi:hypothetical protein
LYCYDSGMLEIILALSPKIEIKRPSFQESDSSQLTYSLFQAQTPAETYPRISDPAKFQYIYITLYLGSAVVALYQRQTQTFTKRPGRLI